MKDPVIVTVQSDPRYLTAVRAVAARMAELGGIAEEDGEQIKLAVDEACTNVIRYAYNGDTGGKIIVKFRITKKRFSVVIEDKGVKADPEFVKGRSLDDLRPGGLGIHLIRRAFDVVEFDEKKKNGNRLILIKNMGRKT